MLKKSILSSLLLISSLNAQAVDVQTDGGIEVYDKPNGYWFTLNGIVKTDMTYFIGDFESKRDEFPSGGSVRSVESTLRGGVGNDFTYSVTLGFDSGVSVNDAYFTYQGFKNTELSFGQVISPFCLENANSSKAVPFLERSLPVIALRPCMGIGVNVGVWGDHTSFKFASTTPLQGTNRDTATIKHRSDRLTNVARFVWAPIKVQNDVTQVGASVVYAQNNPTFRDDTLNTDGRRFSTRPEAKARNTLAIINSGSALGLKEYWQFGFEAAQQWGPLLVQAEYLGTLANRAFDPNVYFYGWHADVAYVVTGETRPHKMKNGSFGTLKPQNCYGAVEVAARYSMVNLNDQDVHGGREHNFAVSAGWYVNTHLKIMTNYIYANIVPTQELGAMNPNPSQRYLHIVAARAQVDW